MLGNGSCFRVYASEHPHRIGSWTEGSISAAKAACEANAVCVGVHYDAKLPDFVLLAKIGIPGGQDPGRRSCYKYHRPMAPTGTPTHPRARTHTCIAHIARTHTSHTLHATRCIAHTGGWLGRVHVCVCEARMHGTFAWHMCGRAGRRACMASAQRCVVCVRARRVCVRVCVCTRADVCACARARVSACARARECVRAWQARMQVCACAHACTRTINHNSGNWPCGHGRPLAIL